MNNLLRRATGPRQPSKDMPVVLRPAWLRFSSLSQSLDDDETEPIIIEEPLDFFQLLNVPRRFAISPETLKDSYRQLMLKYHPDRHTHDQSYDDRQAIQQQASQVTNAYQILKEPHSRATHLLEIEGHGLDQEGTDQERLVGMEFLMHIWEVRESVESTDALHLRPLWLETQHHMEELMEELDQAFLSKDYEKAAELSAQLQYWHRIETAIYEKMEDEE